MEKWLLVRKNNKGSSMVMVVAALGLVSILAAVVLSASFMNYRMKLIERTTKENFYSAEAALEEIRAGIQGEVSNAFGTAYQWVMENYESGGQRESIFCNKFQEALRRVYENPVRPGYYGLSTLEQYLSRSVVYDEANDYLYGAYLTDTVDPRLGLEKNGVRLENLIVNYKDEKGNLSTIKTDILLVFPEMNFAYYTSMPKLGEYVLVANHAFLAEKARGAVVTVKGNMYAGKERLELETGTAMTVEQGYTLTTGEVIIGNNARFYLPGAEMELWAKDIQVNAARLELAGVTHVANDLKVSGKGSNILLKNQYIGFGNVDNKAESSSAIVINGRNTIMDLSGLKYLELAGNAYISVPQADGDNVDIKMGESLTVKSSQLAYLVPAELVGQGMSHGGSNPMTRETWNGLVQEYEDSGVPKAQVQSLLVNLDDVPKWSGKSLRQLGVSGTRTVFYQNSGSTMVYVFLEFEDTRAASNYFKAYYEEKENKEKLDRYLRLYAQEIQMNEEGVRFHLNGNVLVYNGTEAGYYSDTIDQDEEDQAYFQEKQKGQQEIYEALHTKLITSYSKLTEEEKSRDVFENLVDVSQIAADIPAGTEQEFVSEDGTLYGIIANNEGMGPLRLEESNVQQGERRLCFVIATGNVVLDSCRYRGLLLAGGAVTAQGEVTLERDEDSFLKVMKAKGQTMPEENRKGMFEYLAGGELYMTGNIASHTPDIEEYFHLTDLIVCENWEKW